MTHVLPVQGRCAALTCRGLAPTLGRVLKVSQKLEYAMRAMIELARRADEGVLVPAREIAARQQIPLRFLEQQLGALNRGGLVQSFRGAGGGCRLSRTAETITVADIAAAIEGQVFPMGCLEPSDHTCFADSRCGLQGFWGDVAQAIDRVFRETTVADLVARQQEMAPLLIAPEALLSRLN
jgi:Rrf2 family protein